MNESVITIALSTGLFIIGIIGWLIHDKSFDKFSSACLIITAAIINFIWKGSLSDKTETALIFTMICMAACMTFYLIFILIGPHNPDSNSKSELPE